MFIRISDFGFDSDRQFNREPAALADGAAHEHAATVRFDDVFHNAQADADALSFAAQFRSRADRTARKSFRVPPAECLRRGRRRTS